MDKTCPFLKKPCVEHACRWYIQLLGANPQTGEQMNKWGCSVEFIPILLIENSQQARQHAAAVESMRNEARKDAVTLRDGMAGIAKAMTEAASAVLARNSELPRLPSS